MKAQRLCPWQQADVTAAVQRLKELARQIFAEDRKLRAPSARLGKRYESSPAGDAKCPRLGPRFDALN